MKATYRTNIHHHFYTRADYNRTKVGKLIRNHELSKSEMLVPIHNELHRYVEAVEAPITRVMAERVLFIIRELPIRYTSLDAAKTLRDSLYDTDLDYLSDQLNRQIPFLELSRKALARRII